MLLQLDIPEQLGAKLQELQRALHLGNDDLLKEALAQHVGDLEDRLAILTSQKTPQKTVSAADLRAQLGL